MGKLVVLKFESGSFEQGFSVSLQLGEEGKSPTVQVSGDLPPLPQMPLYYNHWRKSYESLGIPSRLSAPANQTTNVSLTSDCLTKAKILRSRFNTWLRSEGFLPLREKCLEELHITDELRVIIQTKNPDVQRLPWHLSEFLERYPKAEIALSAPDAHPQRRPDPQPQVRILAILGHSAGINVEADRQMLETLPGAMVTFLVEPDRKTLTDELWRQAWDILFFAGHSITHADQSGVIYINPQESLSVAELRYSLQEAIGQGLRLAIFNSCDGLGLAWDLAGLHIPQTIVMREPVPDRVAQEFLKYFLTDFSQGRSLYLSVRRARQRLESLEHQFPCATWLPVIFQNLVEQPPTWQELETGNLRVSWDAEAEPASPIGTPSKPEESWVPSPSQPEPRWTWKRLLGAGLASVAAAGAIGGIRHLGWLQAWELSAYDHLLRVRSVVAPEKPDDRIRVIEITDDDLLEQERLGELKDDKSISDARLLKLLTILAQHSPAAIGLDLQRDPQNVSGALVRQMQAMPNLIAVCKGREGNLSPGFAPPQGMPNDRIGFADAVPDPDQVLRRQILYMKQEEKSPCLPGKNDYAFNVKLAQMYWSRQRQSPPAKMSPAGYWQVGSTVFRTLDVTDGLGGYQHPEQRRQLGEGQSVRGSQLLLNYRDPARMPRVPLGDVLRSRINLQDLRGQVILVGVTHSRSDDKVATPYDPAGKTPGVFVQAEMVSQLISAVLDGRRLLQVWPMWADGVWIGGWAIVGSLLIVGLASPRHQIIGVGLGVLLVYGSSVLWLVQGHVWVPLVPSMLGLLLASSTTTAMISRNLHKPVGLPR